MRTTPAIMQTFKRAGQIHVECVPFSVPAIGIYVFAYCVCKGVSNVVNVFSFTNVAFRPSPYLPHPYGPCQTQQATESGRAYDDASH